MSCITIRNLFSPARECTSIGLAKAGLPSCGLGTEACISARTGCQRRSERTIIAATAIPAATPTALPMNFRHAPDRRGPLTSRRFVFWLLWLKMVRFAFFTWASFRIRKLSRTRLRRLS